MTVPGAQGALPLHTGQPAPWKILTLHEPWASAIIVGTPTRGYKNAENRNWRTAPERFAELWTHRLFIHAGRTLDAPADLLTPDLKARLRAANIGWEACDVPDWAWPAGYNGDPVTLPFGMILGYVRYYACTRGWHPGPWAERGSWHHWLSDPTRVDPIPATGKLGFWTPTPKDGEAGRLLTARLDAVP